MKSSHLLRSLTLVACVGLLNSATVAADQTRPAPKPRPSTPHRIGIQGFGTAAIGWPVAKDSFEAAGLDTQLAEFGGGARVTDLWRRLFVEVSASRWSSAGERAFVDEDGTRYPLGIPLDVKATHIDLSIGWRARAQRFSTFVGAGAGSVTYSESSPFAQSGDDLDTRATSYHVLGGLEFPLLKWLAISGELRYRFVPDLLGEGGVSAVLDEDRFGGLQTALGVRVGFGGASAPITKRPPPPPPASKGDPQRDPGLGGTGGRDSGVMIETAPVFLLPDATRKPLRMLDAGTSLRILQITGDWVRVEFSDRQFGPRQGYVQRKYVRAR